MGCRDICPVLGEDLTEQHIVRGLCAASDGLNFKILSVLILHSCSLSVICATTMCGE